MIQFGNKKLSKDIAIFSTSAGVEGSCEQNCEGCYALKIEKIRAVVRNYRKRNLVLAKSELFQYLMIAQIVEKMKKRKIKYFRVHEGGDFFSQEYIDVWEGLACTFREITFYAYTSNIGKKGLDFSQLMKTKNFIVIDSLKARDGKPGYADEETLLKEGLGDRICRLKKGQYCGKHCTYCITKEAQRYPPVFIKH